MARKMSSRVGEEMEKDSTLRRSFSFSRIPKRAVYPVKLWSCPTGRLYVLFLYIIMFSADVNVNIVSADELSSELMFACTIVLFWQHQE